MKKYKLIKRYPLSPALGFIIIDNELNLPYQIENYPEYWEEVVEKDYEIIAFKSDLGTIFNVDTQLKNVFRGTDALFSLDKLLENSCVYIHSVKRLSDSEVFTIGDRIDNFNIINGFSIGTEKSQKHMLFFNGCYSISLAIKSKELLFTTEDGVDIFENDKSFGVTTNWVIILYNGNKYGVQGNVFFDNKWFSTEKAAKEYILLNKPCLSLNDIIVVTKFSKNGILMTALRKLVKSKL